MKSRSFTANPMVDFRLRPSALCAMLSQLTFTLVVMLAVTTWAGDVERLPSGRPITGPHVPGIEIVDRGMDEFMQSINCQAATITVTRGDVTIGCRGYGWMDQGEQTPTKPTTPMRIASCTKPITAAAVKRLIRDQVISADLPVFPFLGFSPKTDHAIDDRMSQITVAHLLKHRGGFDRKQTFDPMFRTKQIEQSLNLSHAATSSDVITYMVTQPLQFDPGERSSYSNYGYAVLGRVIEKASGRPYFDFIQDAVTGPLRICDLSLSRSRTTDRPRTEVWYPVDDDAFSMEIMDAHGGLTTSSISLCKFMSAYWISGEPRKPGERQNWLFFGSLPGTTAMMLQREDGTNCAVLLNGRRDRHFNQDNQRLRDMVNRVISSL